MNESKTIKTGSEENVLFGIIGAFLFSLVGGVMYVVLSMIGFIAAISGLIGVVCAIKGYTFFAKKESKKGIIISVIISALVLVIAWYVGFCIGLVDAYELWYETGEADFVPTIFEALQFGFLYIPDNLSFLWDLVLSLGLGAIGCWSYVATTLKRQKALAEAAAAADNIAAEQATDSTAVPTEEAPADSEDKTE